MDNAVVSQPAEFAQEKGGRAKARQGGLEEVEPDENREKDPPRTDIVGQDYAEQDHGSGEKTNEGICFHNV